MGWQSSCKGCVQMSDLLLANVAFVEYSCEEVLDVDAPSEAEMTELHVTQGFLQAELERRFQLHIDTGIKYGQLKAKGKMWVWKWVKINLGVGGLWYLLLRVVDTSTLSPSQAKCLLAAPNTRQRRRSRGRRVWIKVTPELYAEIKEQNGKSFDYTGSYLQWDRKKKVWRRSGFSARIFGRNKEHTSPSYRRGQDSHFYQFYVRDGVDYFEDEIETYLGFACNPKQIQSAVSLLQWDDETLAKLDAGKWGGKRYTLEKRKECMVGYLMELVGDLLLDTNDCLSEAPGFEGPLGYGHILSDWKKQARSIAAGTERYWKE